MIKKENVQYLVNTHPPDSGEANKIMCGVSVRKWHINDTIKLLNNTEHFITEMPGCHANDVPLSPLLIVG